MLSVFEKKKCWKIHVLYLFSTKHDTHKNKLYFIEYGQSFNGKWHIHEIGLTWACVWFYAFEMLFNVV